MSTLLIKVKKITGIKYFFTSVTAGAISISVLNILPTNVNDGLYIKLVAIWAVCSAIVFLGLIIFCVRVAFFEYSFKQRLLLWFVV